MRVTNKVQFQALFLLYCQINLHVSGAPCTHQQEYIKLQSQPLVQAVYIADIEVKSITTCCPNDLVTLLGVYIKLQSQPLVQAMYIGDREVKSVKNYPQVGQLPHCGHAKVRQLPDLRIILNGFYFSVTDIHGLYQWL